MMFGNKRDSLGIGTCLVKAADVILLLWNRYEIVEADIWWRPEIPPFEKRQSPTLALF